MSNFKGMKQTASAGGGSFVDVNKMIKMGSNYRWVDNKLKADDKYTEVRMLPIFKDGELQPVLNPAGIKSEEEDRLGALSDVFYYAEMCQLWRSGMNTFITNVQPIDSEGEPVAGKYTPFKTFARRLKYKIDEQKIKRSMGLDTDIPEEWFAWIEEGKLPNPQQVLMFRCAFSTVNGVAQKDMKGNLEWQMPGVFAIPRSAMSFLAKVTSKEDDEADLSETNNMFGDFYSPTNGRVMRLTRSTAKAGNGENGKTSYELILSSKVRQIPQEASEKVYQEWEDILAVPTVEESVAQILKFFGNTAVGFALRGTTYEKYLSAEVLEAGADIAKAESIDSLKAASEINRATPPARKSAPAPIQHATPTQTTTLPKTVAAPQTQLQAALAAKVRGKAATAPVEEDDSYPNMEND